MKSRAEPTSWSLYYGQDNNFRTDRIELDKIYKIKQLADVSKVPVGLELSDFEANLDQVFETSDAQASELVNVIYLIKKLLDRKDLRQQSRRSDESKKGRKRTGTTKKVF
jgi:hypothetical protein